MLKIFGATLVGLLIALTAVGQFKNIKVTEAGFSYPLTPSVEINEKNPKNFLLAIGHNQSFYSLDSGSTWMESSNPSESKDALDPIVFTDIRGHFHLLQSASQGTGRAIISQASSDKGKSWGEVIQVADPKDHFQRRPQASDHFLRGNTYSSWTEFERYAVNDSTCFANVLFSTSSNDGKRWTEPVQINRAAGMCADNSNTPQGSAPVMSVEGRLYIVWSFQENIYFDRSFDSGKTWLQTDVAISKQPGGSFLRIPGVNPFNSVPVLIIDNSISFFRTSLYAVWADQTNGVDDTDIWMLRSTSRGDLWSQPIRVNHDLKGKHQFIPSITIDEETGILYVAYYDRRAYDDLQTDVYLSYSVDGGMKFTDVKISESPFTPLEDKPFTDRIGISAQNGIISIAWTRQEAQGNSVWTTTIRQDAIIKKEEAPKLQQIRKPTINSPH